VEIIHGFSLTQKKLFDFLQNAAATIPGREGLKLSAFFKNYKKDVGDIFYKNAAFRIQRKQVGSGDYYINDEMIASEFLKSADDAHSLAKIYQNIKDPIEKQQLFDSIGSVMLDKLASSNVVRQGNIDPKRLTAWLDKNSTILDQFPRIKASLTDAAATSQKLADRIKTLKSRVQTVETEFVKEKLRPIIDIVNKDIAGVEMAKVPEAIRGEIQENLIYNVNDLIKRALKEPNLMRVLTDRVKSNYVAGNPVQETRLNMFRKMVWQNIGDKINLEDPKVVLNWMESPAGKRALEIIFSPNQIKKIKTVVDAYDVVMLTAPDPGGAALRSFPWMERIEMMTGSSPRTMTSVMRAWREGRISGQNTLIYLLSRAASAVQFKKFKDMYFEGFSNPDIADILARDIAPLQKDKVNYFTKLPDHQANFIRTWLFNNGIKLPAGVFTEDPIIVDSPTERVTPNKPEKTELIPENSPTYNESKLNIPAVVPESQLANQNIAMPPFDMSETTPPFDMSAAVETAAVPGGQVTEEQYTSFFPYDTTGQMIAARRAEGGIMNAPRQLKQRVL